jgi:hypothetical protein
VRIVVEMAGNDREGALAHLGQRGEEAEAGVGRARARCFVDKYGDFIAK